MYTYWPRDPHPVGCRFCRRHHQQISVHLMGKQTIFGIPDISPGRIRICLSSRIIAVRNMRHRQLGLCWCSRRSFLFHSHRIRLVAGQPLQPSGVCEVSRKAGNGYNPRFHLEQTAKGAAAARGPHSGPEDMGPKWASWGWIDGVLLALLEYSDNRFIWYDGSIHDFQLVQSLLSLRVRM